MEPTVPATSPTPGAQYGMPVRHENIIEPPSSNELENEKESSRKAADLARERIDRIYNNEPDFVEEEKEVELVPDRSKHQEFIYSLGHSGKSPKEMQQAWHSYYSSLPDKEKHEVWREFYAGQGKEWKGNHKPTNVPAPEVQKPEPIQPPNPLVPEVQKPTTIQAPGPSAPPAAAVTVRTTSAEDKAITQIRNRILERARARGLARADSRLRSLLFGVGCGFVVIVITLLGFFNERFIAPFMTPSKAISSTSIIIDPNNAAAGADPKIIIPKINVDIPVVYDEPTIEEQKIQEALQRGVVHYATTPNPGELGNGVIFGHSANNILNKGSYKFAFVLLHKLEVGDLFYLQKNSKMYVYRVYKKQVVSPSEVSVLNTQEKPATITLITCDPPGTNLNRLIVVGEQITPDPNANAASTANQDSTEIPSQLPSNSPSLWSRFWSWLSH